MKPIRLLPHAYYKISLLARFGFIISEEEVRAAVTTPDRVDAGYDGRKVAQRGVSERHAIRVVYEEDREEIRVVTMYPGRRSRYESEV